MSTRLKTQQYGSGAPMREPVTLDSTGRVLTPTPSRRAKHIRLRTVADCHREAAKVYRGMRSGDIEPYEGTKLVWVLGQISSMIAAGELESRIAALEAMTDDEDA